MEPEDFINQRLSYEIADVLQDNGYLIGDWTRTEILDRPRIWQPPGYEVKPDFRLDHFSIVDPETVQIPYCTLNDVTRLSPKMVGQLWLDNEPRGAKADTQWVVDLYGERNQEKLSEVLSPLATKKNVKLEFRLITNDRYHLSGDANSVPFLVGPAECFGLTDTGLGGVIQSAVADFVNQATRLEEETN